MFPLGTVLFPGAVLPLHVFEARYRRLVADCLEQEGGFGVVLIARGSEVGGGDERCAVATEAHIEEAAALDDGRWVLLVAGRVRVAIDAWLPKDPYPRALVRTLPSTGELTGGGLEQAADHLRRARALAAELGSGPWPSGPPEDEAEFDPKARLWRLCDAAPLGPLDRQHLLELDRLDERVSAFSALAEDACSDLVALLSERRP
jgi:Lon protease-like protein